MFYITRKDFYHKGFWTIVFISKDEDNSPKTLYDKNHQASSQKFRQLTRKENYILTTPKIDFHKTLTCFGLEFRNL